MVMTIPQLRSLLDPDEPNYPQIKVLLAQDDLPNLEALAQGPDVMLAMKATYAISLLGTQPAAAALGRIAANGTVNHRIAVAGGLVNLRGQDAGGLTDQLLGDANVSVRKLAIKAAAALRIAATANKLRAIQANDAVPALRKFATQALARLP